MSWYDVASAAAGIVILLTFNVLPWHHPAFARFRLRWADRFHRWWTISGVAYGLLMEMTGWRPPIAWQAVAAGNLLAASSLYALIRAWNDRPKRPRRRTVSDLARKLAARIAAPRPIPARAGA